MEDESDDAGADIDGPEPHSLPDADDANDVLLGLTGRWFDDVLSDIFVSLSVCLCVCDL